MDQSDGAWGPTFDCMSTNAHTDSERTDSVDHSRFYVPATPGTDTGPGPVERFLTRLYDSHRRLLRRTE